MDEGVRDGEWGGVSHPQPTSGSGERRNLSPPAGSGAEPRPQTHSDQFLAAETFLMATFFTILVYGRRDEIVGNTCKNLSFLSARTEWFI